MNNHLTRYYFCLVMLMIWQPAQAAGQSTVLTLKECMDFGLANDYTFKIQSLKVKQVAQNKSALATRFLPQVDGYLNHQYTFGSAIDPNTNSRVAANFQYDNVGINTQINLFNFSELWESKLQSKDIDIENAKSIVVEQEYKLSLIEKFYAALGAQEWLKIVHQQLENTKLQVDRISKEVQSGLKPESDFYDIQVVYTQEKKALIAVQQDEINKKNDLLQWINKLQQTNQVITLIHTTAIASSDNSTNVEQHAAVVLEKLKKEKLEFEQKQLLNSFLPKVNLGYSFSTFFSQKVVGISNTSFDFGGQLKNNKNQYLGLGIQMPIFSRGDNIKNRKIKALQINEQDLQIEKAKLAQTNLLTNYDRKLHQYQDMIPILSEAFTYAEKSLVTTQDKYSFGKVDISAYKSAKNQLLSSSYDIINNNLSIYMSEQLILLLKESRY